MRWRPFSIRYELEGNGIIVHLAGRSEQGKRVYATVKGLRPFFYVAAGEGQVSDLVLQVDTASAVSLWGQPLDKLHVRFPFDIARIRDNYSHHFEADVQFERRVRYELGIKDAIESPDGQIAPGDISPSPGPLIMPRVAVIDIEVMDKHKFSDPKEADAPVRAIAVWDDKTDRFLSLLDGTMNEAERMKVAKFYQEKGWKVQTIECANEADVFRTFTQFLDKVQPDLLTGWNYVKFDHEYLVNRGKRMGYVVPEWRQFAIFDLMDGYERQYEGELESKSLDFVSQLEGLGKKNNDGMRTWEMYDRCKDKLLAYNVNDVFLTKGIMLKKNLLGFFLRIAGLAGCGIEDTLSSDRLVNSYMFHRLKGKAVQKSNVYSDGPRKQIQGATVFAPAYGLFPNVVEVDNSGEYAAIIRTGNLSPETIIDDPSYDGPCHVFPSGHRYRKEPRGHFPSVSDELTAERDRLKKGTDREQERVVKELNLSLYGTMASPHYRNHDQRIGADITDVARRHVMHNRSFVEAEPNAKALYGDTDSTLFYFTDLPSYDESKTRAVDLTARLNATYDQMALDLMGAEKHYLSVKLEHVYDMFLQTGVAKRYACIYRDPKGELEKDGIRFKMKVRGFEVRRSNAAPFTRTLQKRILEMALLGEGQEAIVSHIRAQVKALEAGEVPAEQVGIPTGIKQDTYGKSLPIHVRAAQWSNAHLAKNFGLGSKPVLYFASIDGKPKTDVFALDWGEALPEGARINWTRTLERVMFSPMRDILETLGINTAMLTSDVAPADDFF